MENFFLYVPSGNGKNLLTGRLFASAAFDYVGDTIALLTKGEAHRYPTGLDDFETYLPDLPSEYSPESARNQNLPLFAYRYKT